MSTFVLSEVSEFKGTSKAGKPYTKYSFKDGNGNVIGESFDAKLSIIGASLLGKRVAAELEPASNPAWAPTLKALAEVPEAELPAEQKPVDWDSKERRDFKSRAWAQAISASQHTGKAAESAKEIYVRVKPLADAIYKDICGDFAAPVQAGPSGGGGGNLPDDDIPFA